MRGAEISIIVPGGWIVVDKVWLGRSRPWIGTIVANWRAWAFGFEWLGNGLLLHVGPVCFVGSRVTREPGS